MVMARKIWAIRNNIIIIKPEFLAINSLYDMFYIIVALVYGIPIYRIIISLTNCFG